MERDGPAFQRGVEGNPHQAASRVSWRPKLGEHGQTALIRTRSTMRRRPAVQVVTELRLADQLRQGLCQCCRILRRDHTSGNAVGDDSGMAARRLPPPAAPATSIHDHVRRPSRSPSRATRAGGRKGQPGAAPGSPRRAWPSPARSRSGRAPAPPARAFRLSPARRRRYARSASATPGAAAPALEQQSSPSSRPHGQR